MVSENCLRIQNGFHLLQDQTVDQFIPNDTTLGDCDDGKCAWDVGEMSLLTSNPGKPVIVLTGPNSR